MLSPDQESGKKDFLKVLKSDRMCKELASYIGDTQKWKAQLWEWLRRDYYTAKGLDYFTAKGLLPRRDYYCQGATTINSKVFPKI